MVQAGGLEPPAYFLGGSRSILMSYACNNIVNQNNDLIIFQSVSVQLVYNSISHKKLYTALYCKMQAGFIFRLLKTL
mgnify:FL=1